MNHETNTYETQTLSTSERLVGSERVIPYPYSTGPINCLVGGERTHPPNGLFCRSH